MSDPMSYSTFLRILRAEGLTVIEHYTDGRDPSYHNRNHKGAWGPVHGVMIHHTVTSGHDSTINICRTGHSSLPGPLCHGVICKAGHIHVVGYGRANHAGSGDDDVLRAVINETALPADNEANTDGNRYFYGFECENLGDGRDPWPAAQLLAIEKASAAIARHHGWSERSVIGHLEWQPGKIDPRGFTMDSMRNRIKDRLAGGGQEEENVAISAEDLKKIADEVLEYQVDDPRTEGVSYISLKSLLWWAGADAAQANYDVKAVKGELAKVQATLDAILAKLNG